MSSVDLKSEAELRAMSSEQLAKRLRDVVETLRMMRKEKKKGYSNPPIYRGIKREKKTILRIQRQRRSKLIRQRKWTERATEK